MSDKKLERRIGDEFYSGFYGKSYKVCRPKFANKCTGCAFDCGKKTYISDATVHHLCNGLTEETGECVGRNRSDGIDVIFKEVQVCKR